VAWGPIILSRTEGPQRCLDKEKFLYGMGARGIGSLKNGGVRGKLTDMGEACVCARRF
jgi:hypothetical protein